MFHKNELIVERPAIKKKSIFSRRWKNFFEAENISLG